MSAGKKTQALEAQLARATAALRAADEEHELADRERVEAARAYAAEPDAHKALPLLHARERTTLLEADARAKSPAAAVDVRRAQDAIEHEQGVEAAAAAAALRAEKLAELARLAGIAGDASTRADVLAYAVEIHTLKLKMAATVQRASARLATQAEATAAATSLAAELGEDFAPDAPVPPGLLRFAVAHEAHLDPLPLPLGPFAGNVAAGPAGLPALMEIAAGALDARGDSIHYQPADQVRDLLAGTHTANLSRAHRVAREEHEERKRREAEREHAERVARHQAAQKQREDEEKAYHQRNATSAA